ncbi:cadherin-like domain-containing protein [Psychromarinibacter sp. S121]|uniref:cadherin-like domain-containing protein n=1 Tax=Psychromarinibacter sp. S121 TaxID=3415127 RepID=UPI003C7C26F1
MTELVYSAPGVAEFNGAASGVQELGHTAAYEISEGTIAFSFIADDTNGAQGLFTKDASGYAGGGNHFALYLEGNTLRARFQDGATEVFIDYPGIVAGEEYEIAVTFGAGGSALWVDGVMVGSSPLVMDWTQNVEVIQWGGRGWGSASGQTGFDAPFEGVIADRQIYDAALSSTDIATLAGSSSATNSAPTPTGDAVTTDEDTPLVIDVADLLLNDTDPDGDPLSITGVATQPTNGTAVYDNGTGTITYTPDADFNGADSFTVTVEDGVGGVVTSVVDVTVAPVNDAPVAEDDLENVVVMGEAVVIDVLGNDSDLDGPDALTVTIVTDGALGTVVNNGDGTVTYTSTGTAGDDSFTYTISDGDLTATATVEVSVLTEANVAPEAVADDYSIAEDGVLTVAAAGVLANDTDGNGDPLSASVVTDVTDGTLVLNGDGSFTYTPDADFNGTDSFVYQVSDGLGGTDTATVTITVDPEADDPVAADDTAATSRDVPVVIDVLANDDDADGDPVTVTGIGAAPSNGAAVVNANGTITYTPDAGFFGTDTFTYAVEDGTGGTDTATVTVTVSGVPDPVYSAAGATEFNGTAGGVLEIPHSAIYELPEGTIAFSFIAADTNGAQGLFTKDASGYVGGGNHFALFLDGTTLRARFQDGSSEVYINHAGIVAGEEYEIAVTFGAGGSALWVDGVMVGSSPLVMDWTQNVEVIQWGGRGWGSASGQTGFDAPFEGVIADRQIYDTALSSTDIATLAGVSSGTNAAPTPLDDAVTTDEDTPLVIDVADLLLNDTDPDGDLLSVTGVATQPSNGTAVYDNGTGTITYTPITGFEGTDTFTYSVSDGSTTSTATVEVTVIPAPGPSSSDFSGAELDPAWTFEGPAGTSSALQTNATDAFLSLVTPDGNFDIWNENNAARAMQEIEDEDFSVETRFLSTPSERYQMQGLLVEQDADNWLRFDTHWNGSQLIAFGAVTVDGVSSTAFQVTVPGGTAPYLRLTRADDLWTLEYSQDGSAWTVAGSVTHVLEATSFGVFAGNTEDANGFTAQVDYVEFASDPILNEDGDFVPPSAPEATDDALATEPDTALVFTAEDLLSNDTDPDGDTLTIESVGTPSNGVLIDNLDGTWTYTPDSGFEGTDTFTYVVSDGTDTDTATVTVSVRPPSGFDAFSDDFSGTSLDNGWEFKGITGSATLATIDTDAVVLLDSPQGIAVSASDVMTTPRLMQDVADGDFQISAGFLNEPEELYQEHGLLVVQDEGNWIRFDLAYTHLGLTLIVGQIVDGSTTYPLFDGNIADGEVAAFRITRTGDDFIFETSSDGTNWQQAYALTRSMTVTEVGAFAGTAPYQGNEPPGYTAQLDYFENSADPIINEDGALNGNRAPVAADDDFQTDPDTVLVLSENDLLGNDSDPDDDTLTIDTVGTPTNGTLVDNGNGTWTYTPDGGFEGDDSFTYTVTDGEFSDTATVSISVALPPDVVSDDFSSATLDPAWRSEGPTGTSSALATNATDAFLSLITPDGNHDVWGTNNSARVMQSIPDEDFAVEARFLSMPSQQYQMQGFIVEQDAQNWLRFDVYHDGSRLYAFGASTVNGVSSSEFQVTVPGNSAPFLRLARVGDQWTFEYSADGSNWTTGGTFSHGLEVTSAGVFAGNVGDAQGFTAHVDYVEFDSAPLVDEDADYEPVNTAPEASDDTFYTEQDTPLILSAANLLANDDDLNGDDLFVESIGTPSNGDLVDNGDGTWTYTPDAGFQGTDTFVYTVSDGDLTDTATVEILTSSAIDVWYGSEQTFGAVGETQVWVNILGTVYGDVASLSYTLNGGTARGLAIGEDTRRLHDEGDFNVEIAYSELDGSATDDVVAITAVMTSGDVITRNVTIDYESGNVWSPNYSIDWQSAGSLEDVVQVVDGTWEIGSLGARPVDLGYDRLLTFGDESWDNYQLAMTVTPHDLLNQDPRGRDGGAFGIGMLWNGHTDDPIGGFQPHSGWEPGAAFVFSDTDGNGVASLTLHPSENFFSTLGSQSISMDEDLTYNIVMQVEQVNLYDRLYSIRVWEEGTSEPAGWTLQGIQTFGMDYEPATGSVYLNAHYNDVSFGDITVTEITGRDIVKGTDSADTLIAVDTGDANPGSGEIDVFVGRDGGDTFVFGDSGDAYYGTDGDDDYGFVWDFVSGEDHVELWGAASDYVLVEDQAGLTAGTAIYLSDGGSTELVGLLNGVYGLDLTSGDFMYTGSDLVT